MRGEQGLRVREGGRRREREVGKEGERKGGEHTSAEPVLVLLARVADRDVALRAALRDAETVTGDDDVGCVGAAWGGDLSLSVIYFLDC